VPRRVETCQVYATSGQAEQETVDRHTRKRRSEDSGGLVATGDGDEE